MNKRLLAVGVVGGLGWYAWRVFNNLDTNITTFDGESGRGSFLEVGYNMANGIKNKITLNENGNLTPSLKVLNLLKKIEKFSAMPYLAQEGQMTVGYGHVIKKSESFNSPLTEAEANQLFLNDLNELTGSILNQINVPLSQNQYDALASFVFNVGHVGYDMADYINKLDFDNAANEFMKFVYYSERKNGKKTGRKLVSNGLYARRSNEMKIFKFGIYPNDLTALS